MMSAGRGLVAAAHQHRAVDRDTSAAAPRSPSRGSCGTSCVVGFWNGLAHSAIAGISTGKAARLPHAALHLLGARAEMRVARIDVAPGVDDARSPACRRNRCARSPSAAARERWPNARRSPPPNQRWLRRSSGRFFLSVIPPPPAIFYSYIVPFPIRAPCGRGRRPVRAPCHARQATDTYWQAAAAGAGRRATGFRSVSVSRNAATSAVCSPESPSVRITLVVGRGGEGSPGSGWGCETAI